MNRIDQGASRDGLLNRQSDQDDALALAERAIGLARTMRLSGCRALLEELGGIPGALSIELRARIELARAYLAYFERDPRAAAETIARARQMALAAGLPALSARCSAADAHCQLRIDGEVQWAAMLRQVAEAVVMAACAPADSRDRIETEYLAEALTGSVEHAAGRVDLALAAYQRAMARAEALDEVMAVGQLRHRIAALEARTLRERWFERGLRQPGGRPVLGASECARVRGLLAATVDHCERHDLPATRSCDELSLAFIDYLTGDAAGALRAIERLLPRVLIESPWPAEAFLGQADRALCLLALGREREADGASEALIERLRDDVLPGAAAIVWRVRRLVCDACGDPSGAAQAETRALLAWDTHLTLQSRVRAVLSTTPG
jgi:tetratricopeptide (TPR) repeat protein